MKRALALLVCAALPAPALAAPAIDLSGRASVWSSDRTGTDDGIEAAAELWGRIRHDIGTGASVRFGGWAGANANGAGHISGDVRDAHLAISFATGSRSWCRSPCLPC